MGSFFHSDQTIQTSGFQQVMWGSIVPTCYMVLSAGDFSCGTSTSTQTCLGFADCKREGCNSPSEGSASSVAQGGSLLLTLLILRCKQSLLGVSGRTIPFSNTCSVQTKRAQCNKTQTSMGTAESSAWNDTISTWGSNHRMVYVGRDCGIIIKMINNTALFAH